MDKPRILVGEDDPVILKMTTYRLQHEGFTVLSAADGEETLRQAESSLPIHVILLDINMPRRNGYEVCQELKKRPATARIPVIIFTGSERRMTQLADRCIEAGAADWIKKPFHTKELLEKIHRAMEAAQGGSDG